MHIVRDVLLRELRRLDGNEEPKVDPSGALLIMRGEFLEAIYAHKEWSSVVWVEEEPPLQETLAELLRSFEHKWLGYCIDENIMEEIRDLLVRVQADADNQIKMLIEQRDAMQRERGEWKKLAEHWRKNG